MYYMEDNQQKTYFLYDYANRMSSQIFRWIDFSDPTAGVGPRPNGLYYVEEGGGTGINFALDLSMEQITENQVYNDIMKHISIDDVQGFVITSMFGSLTKSDYSG